MDAVTHQDQTPSSTALAGWPPRLRRLTLFLIWAAIAGGALALNFVAIPARVAEMLVIQATPGDCALGQLTAQEQAALAGIGISMGGYIAYLEVVAALFVLGNAVAAAFLFLKRSQSWIPLIASLFLLVAACCATLNLDALARGDPPASHAADLGWAVGYSLVALLFYLFPSGRFAPGWTRWPVVGLVIYQAARVVFPGVAESLLGSVPQMDVGIHAVVYGGGLASQVYRYRRISTPLEKQQTKWVIVAFAANLLVFAVVAATVRLPPELSGERILDAPLAYVAYEVGMFHLYMASFLMIPAAFLFSILRHRLWDVDFLIHRSLLYGLLTTVLAAVFVGCVVLLQQVFSLVPEAMRLPMVVGLSVAAVAALFPTMRGALHRLVDRWIFGIEIDYDPWKRRRSLSPATVEGEGTPPSWSGQLEDLQPLARGGMADVYLASSASLEQTVVVKVLSPGSGDDDDDLARRFQREACIISELDHPNIVRIHGYGEADDGSLFIVMEYVTGGDLGRLLRRRRRLNVEEVGELLSDICSALDHAHARNVVHRDVKPSNVLLRPVEDEGRVSRHCSVLTDFGIAKMLTATRITTTNPIGTLQYVSPEQINDPSSVDGRSDVYSTGILSYRMLTGQLPFAQNNPTALLIAHLLRPPPDPREIEPDIPDQVARAVLRAIAKNPAERFATAGELIRHMFDAEPGDGDARPDVGTH